jgi:hypothetical protein
LALPDRIRVQHAERQGHWIDPFLMLVKLLKDEKIPYANELIASLITKADLDRYHQLNDKVDQLLGAP